MRLYFQQQEASAWLDSQPRHRHLGGSGPAPSVQGLHVVIAVLAGSAPPVAVPLSHSPSIT